MWALVVLAVVAGLMGARGAARDATSVIVMHFAESAASGTQVFVAPGFAFSELDSIVLPAVAAADVVKVAVPRGHEGTIRLDPVPGNPLAVCGLDVEGRSTSGSAYRAVGFHQLASLEERDSCLVAVPLAGADDPQVILQLEDGGADAIGWATMAWLIVAAASALAAMVLLVSRVRAGHMSGARRNVLVWLYLAMSMAAGVLYAVVTPPGAVTDEYAHVTKAVKVASGVLVGSTGDRPFPNIFEMYGRFDGYLDPSVKFSATQLLTQVRAPVPCEPSTAALPHGADAYPPHLYLVPAAAYALSCSLDQDVGFFLLLSRLGNLILASLLIALGIWATRRARWVLFACALLPMTVYQVASVSADSLTLALSFAWIGVVCGIAEGRIAVTRAGWLLAPLAAALAISKPGSAWVLAAILFARPAYLAQVGRFLPTVLKYLVLPFLVHVVWVLYASGSAAPLDGVDPSENLARLLRQPWSVAGLYFETFTGAHGAWLMRSAIGALGWLDVGLHPSSYYLAGACLVASLFMGSPVRHPPAAVTIMAMILAAGAVVILSLPLFIYWTLPDSPIILGLQGRYYLPCLAFALAFAAGSPGDGPNARRAHRILTVVVPLVLAWILFDGATALVARYYP